MICENCENEHNGSYGSGRFCNYVCARSFSTKLKRDEINFKVSKKLSENHDGLTKQQRVQRKIAEKHASYIRETELTSLFDLSKRTVAKILRRLKLPCSLCGWFVDDVVSDIHHIIERSQGGTDEHTNLTYICPNCHRLVHSNKIDVSKLITLDDYIGNSWKDHYFVKNGKIENKK